MKSTFKTYNKTLLSAMGIAAVTLLSCSKWDQYKQYTANGEILYSGKMDSVKVNSGNNRVQIIGRMNADPKITTVKIFWNNKQDSITFDSKASIVGGVFNKIFPIAEGNTNFTIYTYDAAGNKSVPVYTSATIYGNTYQSTLQNRLVSDAQILTNGNAGIDWADVNANAGVIGMQIKYTDKANALHDTTIFSSAATGLSSVLPDYKPGIRFQYRTLYKPSPTAIDTFYTSFVDRSVRYDVDVTSQYLSNTGPGFQRATFDGRWGTLAAPWITNAAAKNKDGGVNGGYSSDAGGVINWETWGNTPVTNGIVYQPTSAALPAGKYTIEYNYYSEVQANSSVYCVVAAGGNGIPTLASLSTALASSAMYNGAVVGTTAPNRSETKTFSFTLTSPQVVSIGFLGNLVGSGNPGNYFQMKYLKLWANL